MHVEPGRMQITLCSCSGNWNWRPGWNLRAKEAVSQHTRRTGLFTPPASPPLYYYTMCRTQEQKLLFKCVCVCVKKRLSVLYELSRALPSTFSLRIFHLGGGGGIRIMLRLCSCSGQYLPMQCRQQVTW